MNTKPQKPLMKSNHNVGNISRYILWLSILVGGIVIGISIHSYNTPKPVNNHASNVFSFETLTIAKQFVCSCGSCGEKALIACTCPTAIETKQFIETSINNGLSADDITDILNMTYGQYKG
ncbi:MAG: hypothetical protein IIB95_08100 [Candidatus Marinimicrobia bacterium]|nr:hypothetical protein [Candidatus Neomarinimicrobiota bacterium]MCH7763689.1 hypothetical protein [Candidatus Neomarinimicrobiota bacterium]